MNPPLQPLHSDETLIRSKLERFEKMSTNELIESLRPSRIGSLKARPDGTQLDGHHRVKILKDRGVDVNALPREVIEKLNG